MIRVQQAPAPASAPSMQAKGKQALLELIGDPHAPARRGPKRKVIAERIEDIPGCKLPPFWTEVLDELREAYAEICAYLGMRIHPTGLATVDHFKPKSKHPHLAYEWSNFRFAAHRVNTLKGEHEDVLDPFEIEDGWFALDLGTFEVVPGDGLGEQRRAQVKDTIKRLGLNEGTFCKAREELHDRRLGLRPDQGREPWPASWLKSESPFVFAELNRQRPTRSGATRSENSDED